MTSALNTTLILALFAVMALHPPIPRRPSPFNLQFALGWWINEAPVIGLWWLIAGTIGTLVHARPVVWWWLVAALTVLDLALLARLAARARSARAALAQAFRAVYGPAGQPRYTRPVWWRLLLPVISWRPDVRRIRNVRYGPARRGNRLDVYVSRRSRGTQPAAPVLVYFHSRFANRLLGAQPLIYRLAAQGWVCVSAGRRQFRTGHGEQLADARAALAWVRENAQAHGGDPDRVFAAGGSAGANLAAAAALTGSEVAAVIGLYGFYGSMGAEAGTSPLQVIHPEAPPFLIVHGVLDTLVPLERARAFADRLRAVSRRPVVYAEIPGAQHSFDVFESIRFHAVTDAIVRFAELVSGSHGATPAGPPRELGASKPVDDAADRATERCVEDSPYPVRVTAARR